MKNHDAIGVQIPQVLLPGKGVDMNNWAVIACDQYTSQPDYWEAVYQRIADQPSAGHLILPEVYLEAPDVTERIQRIHRTMKDYLDRDLFFEHHGLVYVEREAAGKRRRGLIMALDLECYDFNKGSTSLIRATEGTIVERIPPRIRIREGAALELPHILVLIDDPQGTVIEPLCKRRDDLVKCYDFDLMMDSGHLQGYLVKDARLEQQVIDALSALADPASFSEKYGVSPAHPVLLFAMGDGNHSLATAKAFWEKIKPEVGMQHPARYALVELENVHDAGLEFEPIHRVLFGVTENAIQAMKQHFGTRLSLQPGVSEEEMVREVENPSCPHQRFGVISIDGFAVAELSQPESNLAVGSLQSFLDPFLAQKGASKVDYVHGRDVVCQLGQNHGHLGFYLPAMHKDDLFKTVILDGALPRKTFSMGEALEKRFYLEARRII